jgi:DNA-binding MarR family transcriptional regulator
MKAPFSNTKEYKFWHQLNRTYKLMQDFRQKKLRKLGVSIIESAVINVVGSAKGVVTPAEISRELIELPHSISQLLIRMEIKGLITRKNSLSRKNMIRVELAPKGEIIFDANRKLNPLDPLISVLTDAEKELMISLLKKIEQKAIQD